jgi:hypothetical protein
MRDTPNVGKLIDGEAHRDAIHVAVFPAFCDCDLQPGDHVGLVPGTRDRVSPSARPIGIVDPFLTQTVRTGEQFYVFLYPGTVTGLRHVWTHPAFAYTPPIRETT